MNAEFLPRALNGIVGGDFSDPTNERIIYLSALGLAVVGLALLVGTIMWWRRGRQEHPALAPLEVMSGRAWFKASEGDRRRRLDHVRLADSEAGGVEAVRAEPLDLEALVRSTPQAFDDLREPGAAPVAAGAGEVAEVAAADNVEPVGECSDEASVVAEPDATSVSIERPAAAVESPADAPELAVATPEAPVEALANGSNDSLTK